LVISVTALSLSRFLGHFRRRVPSVHPSITIPTPFARTFHIPL
jgi:hypothetical protein